MNFEGFDRLPKELQNGQGWAEMETGKRVSRGSYSHILLLLADEEHNRENRTLGFMLGQDPHTPFVVLRLIGGYDPDTDTFQAWALDTIKRLRSYAEVVGHDVHIWGQSKTPPHIKTESPYELLTSGVVEVIGNPVPDTAKTIADLSGKLSAFICPYSEIQDVYLWIRLPEPVFLELKGVACKAKDTPANIAQKLIAKSLAEVG